MNRFMTIVLVLFSILLAGCKPPHFDQTITCPGFHAEHVAIYEYSNPGMLGVLYKDHSWTKVDKTECVISQDK